MCALKWCIVWFSTRETGKKTKQNQLDQGQTVKHNSAHKNLYALGWTFEVSYLFQIKKKRKKEIDIYIVSAECPWKVELHFAPFMLTLMHISYYFFFLPSWKLAAARVSGYWWVSRCCSSLHSLCSADKSTHQHTRGVFLSLSLFPPPVAPCPLPLKNSCQWV